MRRVFADTLYWVGLIVPKDPWHLPALRASQAIAGVPLVTTDAVLLEVLNMVSAAGPHLRDRMAEFVQALLLDPQAEVLPLTRDLFLAGIELYAHRRDKQYSLTDCVSMHVMRDLGLREVLTNDRHFVQEGFTLLMGA